MIQTPELKAQEAPLELREQQTKFPHTCQAHFTATSPSFKILVNGRGDFCANHDQWFKQKVQAHGSF